MFFIIFAFNKDLGLVLLPINSGSSGKSEFKKNMKAFIDANI